MKWDIPEDALRRGVVDLNDGDGKPMHVKVLGCDAAVEWSKDHVEPMQGIELAVGIAEKALNDAKDEDRDAAKAALAKARADAFQAKRDALKAYAPLLFTDDRLGGMNVPQILYAYGLLIRVSDPTLASACFTMNQTQALMPMLELAALNRGKTKP